MKHTIIELPKQNFPMFEHEKLTQVLLTLYIILKLARNIILRQNYENIMFKIRSMHLCEIPFQM